MALENTAQFYDLEQKVRERYAGIQRHAGTGVFECADGYIYVFAGGMAARRFWPNMVKWMQDERVAGADVLSSPQWSDISYVNSDPGKDAFAGIFTDFAKTKTKRELYDVGQARRVPLCPISTPLRHPIASRIFGSACRASSCMKLTGRGRTALLDWP